MMQQAWIQGLNWDKNLAGQFQQSWKHWFSELKQLHTIQIPRCIRADVKVISREVHTFLDASEKVYSGAIYLQNEYTDGTISVRLVAAKTRLAPLKTISIPPT